MSEVKGLTKADVILQKVDKLAQQQSAIEARVNSALGKNKGGDADIIARLKEENAQLKQEMHFISAQVESVYTSLAKMISKLADKVSGVREGAVASPSAVDVDDLSSRVAAKIVIPEIDASVDADYIAQKVAERMPYGAPVATAYRPQAPAQVNAEIDYDALGFSVAKNIYVPQAIAEEFDYDALAEKVASRIGAVQPAAAAAAMPVQAEVDYDLIAEKVAAAVSVQESVSPDYIASKVAEQIVIPASGSSELDVEELSRKVADKIAIPSFEGAAVDEEKIAFNVAERLRDSQAEAVAESPSSTLDEQALAEDIASRLNFSLSDELIANAVVKNLAAAIDSDEIADCVAKRVGTISPEQFEITVDDDGCDSLASAVESKLDYDVIAASVAEKLNPAFMARSAADDLDAEELATAVSEKLAENGAFNEDVIAEKAAAVLSNYLPEIDSDEIADKVVAGLIPSMPQPAVDNDVIALAVADRLVEHQEDSDYDIVIDEEGVNQISDGVSTRIKEDYDVRFNKIEEDIEQLKRMLAAGVIVAGVNESAPADATVEEPVEEELVTVSDIVGDEPAEEPEETDEDAEVMEDDTVEDIDEIPTDSEFLVEEGVGGVDFANMMKYNRSFIARIIQGTDEQKTYYGQVKTALLSYKKVNSNVAWGAERFNKGRETIARFKIRGKTLCLYLALDPSMFETSVYHHADVSDNKSMHGTPMMVKIKSPRGVKKAIRLIDEMLSQRNGEKHNVAERDYAAMYPYETIEELIEDGLVKDVRK